MINYDLEKIKKEIKGKKYSNCTCYKINYFGFFSRLFLTCICVLCILVYLKKKPGMKSIFYTKVYESSFNFASINKFYNTYFGGSLPFSNLFIDDSSMVFSENLVYNESFDYLDGVSLNVGSNYLVPILNEGLIVFIGFKEGYGNTIIVQQADGVDVWYSNISNVSFKLYDYVKKGDFLGECNEYLYLVFKKDGNVIDYKSFI